MSRLYLVRHGNASSTWEPGDWDPGLSELGRAQAEARAAQLAGLEPQPLPLRSSPLRRARETAAALEQRWKSVARVDPRVGEIHSPGVAPQERKRWLLDILQRRWSELSQPLENWRNDVLQALLDITEDTVVFSHFVAINVAVGFALGDDRVTCFRPANCSCSLLELQSGRLRVLELGQEDTSADAPLPKFP